MLRYPRLRVVVFAACYAVGFVAGMRALMALSPLLLPVPVLLTLNLLVILGLIAFGETLYDAYRRPIEAAKRRQRDELLKRREDRMLASLRKLEAHNSAFYSARRRAAGNGSSGAHLHFEQNDEGGIDFTSRP